MGFGSLRIVKGVDRLIYISDTDKGGRTSITLYRTIKIQIYIRIPIDLLNLEVKP